MADVIVLCADGSDLSTAALRAGLAVVGAGHEVVVATVVESPDPMLVTGTGFAGGTMSTAEFERLHTTSVQEAEAVAAGVAAALDVPNATTRVVEGAAGPALCDLAAELGAAALVVGTRGRGGLKRAVLGSVSDHIVRNAPCPVVVTPGL